MCLDLMDMIQPLTLGITGGDRIVDSKTQGGPVLTYPHLMEDTETPIRTEAEGIHLLHLAGQVDLRHLEGTETEAEEIHLHQWVQEIRMLHNQSTTHQGSVDTQIRLDEARSPM